MDDLRRRNRRTGLLLAAVALAFMFGTIAKRIWFG